MCEVVGEGCAPAQKNGSSGDRAPGFVRLLFKASSNIYLNLGLCAQSTSSHDGLSLVPNYMEPCSCPSSVLHSAGKGVRISIAWWTHDGSLTRGVVRCSQLSIVDGRLSTLIPVLSTDTEANTYGTSCTVCGDCRVSHWMNEGADQREQTARANVSLLDRVREKPQSSPQKPQSELRGNKGEKRQKLTHANDSVSSLTAPATVLKQKENIVLNKSGSEQTIGKSLKTEVALLEKVEELEETVSFFRYNTGLFLRKLKRSTASELSIRRKWKEEVALLKEQSEEREREIERDRTLLLEHCSASKERVEKELELLTAKYQQCLKVLKQYEELRDATKRAQGFSSSDHTISSSGPISWPSPSKLSPYKGMKSHGSADIQPEKKDAPHSNTMDGPTLSFCVVCQQNTANVALVPCGHVCLCEADRLAMRHKHPLERCPLCNTTCTSFLHVHL